MRSSSTEHIALRSISIMIGRMAFRSPLPQEGSCEAPLVARGPGRESVPFHRHGPREEPRIALTFDDGPAAATDIALERLARHGADATFFVVGNRIQSFHRVLRQAAAEGHEIGNHSWKHELSGGWFTDLGQLAVTSAQICRMIGAEPRLFRPPYGHLAPGLARTVSAAGLSAIGWDVDARLARP